MAINLKNNRKEWAPENVYYLYDDNLVAVNPVSQSAILSFNLMVNICNGAK